MRLTIVLTVVSVIAMGFFLSIHQQKPSREQMITFLEEKRETSLKTGRFELKQISQYRRDQYLLDTSTGRMWRPACTKVAKNGIDCDGTVFWGEVAVENLTRFSNDDIDPSSIMPPSPGHAFSWNDYPVVQSNSKSADAAK